VYYLWEICEVNTAVLWSDDIFEYSNSEIISNHYTKAKQPQWYQVSIAHARVYMCLKSGFCIILPNQTTMCGNRIGTPIGWATEPGRSVANKAEHDEVYSDLWWGRHSALVPRNLQNWVGCVTIHLQSSLSASQNELRKFITHYSTAQERIASLWHTTVFRNWKGFETAKHGHHVQHCTHPDDSEVICTLFELRIWSNFKCFSSETTC